MNDDAILVCESTCIYSFTVCTKGKIFGTFCLLPWTTKLFRNWVYSKKKRTSLPKARAFPIQCSLKAGTTGSNFQKYIKYAYFLADFPQICKPYEIRIFVILIQRYEEMHLIHADINYPKFHLFQLT